MGTSRIHTAAAAALLPLALLFGCAAESFACVDPSSCATNEGTGICEANGFCSFPDDGCPSGRRFGAYGSSSIAGECVPFSSDSSTSDDGAQDDGPASDDAPVLDSGPSPETSTGGDEATSDSSDDTSDTSTTTDTGTDASTSSTTGIETIEVTIEPAIAVCTDPVNNDPALCEMNAGEGIMTVDVVDGGVNQPSAAFMRFDVSPRYSGLVVVSATLALVVADGPSSGSVSTGILWEAEPFDRPDLEVEQPGLIEPRLGDDQGSVGPDEEVTWSIPTDRVAAGESLHLAIIPVVDDGVDYWNEAGEAPPRLEVVFATSE